MNYAEKIAALIAKAEATTFEAERDAFLAKASELQLKWMIDDSAVRAAAANKDVLTDDLMRCPAAGVEKNSKYVKAKRDLYAELCSIFNVKIVLYSDRSGMALFGFKSDVRFVVQLHASLVMQMLAAMERESDSSVKFRTSFAHGYVSRVSARLGEARRQQEAEARTNRPGTALVLRDRSVDVQKYFSQQMDGARLRKGYKNRATNSHEGLLAGRAAGDRADIGGKRVSRSSSRAITD